MAVTWTIYTRETPDLRDAPSTLVCEVEAFTYVTPEPVYDDPLVDLDFVEIDTDWNQPYDPLSHSSWVDEIRFRVACTAPDSQRELAWAFSIEVAHAAHGAILDAQAKTFAWYGWNLDAMLARVHALIEAHQLADLVTYLTRARDARTAGPGPFLALAERTVAYLDDLPESTAKNHLLVFLTASHDLPADVRHLLEDAVLAAPPKGKPGKPLRDLQAKLRVARDHAWADAQALPTTIAELSSLWDRAHDTVRETYVLDRVFESERLHPLVVDAILARARAGDDPPSWPSWEAHLGQLSFAHTHEFDEEHREFFALCGPLAAWLVVRWRLDEAYAETCDLQLERRRRDGEINVELPNDVLSLLRANEIERAIVEYAKRYELDPEQARRVIDAHR